MSPRFNYAWHHAASNSLILGCWNVEYFRSAQIHFRFLMNLSSILAVSEYCLHEEQLDFFKTVTHRLDYFKTVTHDSHNYTSINANDNPPLLSKKPAHRGVALFWTCSFYNFWFLLKFEKHQFRLYNGN